MGSFTLTLLIFLSLFLICHLINISLIQPPPPSPSPQSTSTSVSEPALEKDCELVLRIQQTTISHPGTMRFQGHICGVSVQILLDSGSTRNFLRPSIAHCLKLPIQSAPKFEVIVGNGGSLTVEGFIEDLHVSIQGHTLQLPVYLLAFTGADFDLVLGVPWLKTLGPHIVDYNALSIKFYTNDTLITLRGE